MWTILSVILLPGPLWPGVVAPERVLSMSQIEQTMYKQMTNVKLCLQYMKPFNSVQKKSSGLFKNVIYKMCLQIMYI